MGMGSRDEFLEDVWVGNVYEIDIGRREAETKMNKCSSFVGEISVKQLTQSCTLRSYTANELDERRFGISVHRSAHLFPANFTRRKLISVPRREPPHRHIGLGLRHSFRFSFGRPSHLAIGGTPGIRRGKS